MSRADWVVAGAVPLLALAGAGLAVGPFSHTVAVAAVVGPLLLMWCVKSAGVRLAVVAVGALAVFQTSGPTGKYAYMGAALLCVALSLVNLRRRDDDQFRQALTLAPFMIVFLGPVSFLIANGNGIGIDAWFRDVLPYLMVVLLPIVGLDAAQHMSARALSRLIAIIGVLAAVNLAVTWLGRRGGIESNLQVLLATGVLSGFALCFALAHVARHAPRWGLAAVVIAGALVLTGSRTNLIVIAAAMLGVIGLQSKGRLPAPRAVGFVMAGGAMVAGIVTLASPWLEEGFLLARYEAMVSVVRGGQDQSYDFRSLQYAAATDRWEARPWLGGGPGYLYRADSLFGVNSTAAERAEVFTLDTPVVVLAKFGVVGTVLLLAYLIAVFRGVAACRRGPAPAFTAARAFAFVLVALVPFGASLEDKGASIAIALMVAVAAATGREQRVASVGDDAADDVGAAAKIRSVNRPSRGRRAELPHGGQVVDSRVGGRGAQKGRV